MFPNLFMPSGWAGTFNSPTSRVQYCGSCEVSWATQDLSSPCWVCDAEGRDLGGRSLAGAVARVSA